MRHLVRCFNLNAPFGHDAEALTGFVGFGLDFAPFGVITEVKGTEMVDRPPVGQGPTFPGCRGGCR
jgi:hypothetical protein